MEYQVYDYSYTPYDSFGVAGDGSLHLYGQYSDGSSHADGNQFQADGYDGSQAWTQDHQQWGWDQTGAVVFTTAKKRGVHSGHANMDRGTKGRGMGRPVFGSGRGGGGGPPAFGFRGGKGLDRGRLKSASGSSRGRGGRPERGRGGDAGRGRGTERVAVEVNRAHMTVTDSGVGISSVGDLIKSAQVRHMKSITQKLQADAPMEQFVECWKNFTQAFVDCGNSISNLECSLKASKLEFLMLRFESDLLVKMGVNSNIFTSTLTLVKKCSAWDAIESESIFLARGLGLNKKAAKLDCYTKAYKLLMDNTVVEIMSQEDTDEDSLRQEVKILYNQNPQGFMELLKKGEGISGSVSTSQAAKRKASSLGQDCGGSGGAGLGAAPAKRSRPPMPEDSDSKLLEPKKKKGILMEKSDPLVTKLAKLKELLKMEGITKLHLVPKIDQFAHKTAINVKNVYKFIEPPSLGFESKTPVYCEIYFDDTFVAASDPNIRRNSSMHEAYCKFADILCSETVERIANNPKKWSAVMGSMIDICNVVTKRQCQDTGCLLSSRRLKRGSEPTIFQHTQRKERKRTSYQFQAKQKPDFRPELDRSITSFFRDVSRLKSILGPWLEYMLDNQVNNLANMRQMMASMPDLKFPVSNMIVIEHETFKNMENAFKTLELSATQNRVLLECEILRNTELNFVCNISLQGRTMASRVHSVKNMAKRLACEAVMEQLRQTNDYIFVGAEYKCQNLHKQELFKLAKEKQIARLEIPQHILKLVKMVYKEKNVPEDMSAEELRRFEDNARFNQEIENQPDNVALRPLLPYLAVVVYDMCDRHYESFSLEDIVICDVGMTRSQREVITVCANKMGMRVSTKVVNKEHCLLLRRSVTAQDMSKILQVVGGSSGRYKQVRCQNMRSPAEMEKFKREFIANYQYLKMARETVEQEEDLQTATLAPGSSSQLQERARMPSLSANAQPQPHLSAQVASRGWIFS